MANTLLPVILSGGSGSRLWPLSGTPKTTLTPNHEIPLQATVKRLTGFTQATINEVLVVSNEVYRFIIAEQLRLLGQANRIVLEPAGRNTAPTSHWLHTPPWWRGKTPSCL